MPNLTLVMTDYGSERCGVGDTMGSWGKDLWTPPAVVDPRGRLKMAIEQAFRVTEQDKVVFVYPTRKGRCLIRTLIILYVFRLRQCQRTSYLHEFRRLRPIHRAYVRLALKVFRGAVIVSTNSEAEYVKRIVGGRTRVNIVPAPAGAAPTVDEQYALDRSDPTPSPSELDVVVLGIFGIPRRDKGLNEVWGLVSQLAMNGQTVRLEVVGTGWEEFYIPDMGPSVTVERLGFVPRSRLRETFAAWDYALAPFADGVSDGRNSYRTPCMYGIPVFTSPPENVLDVTFRSSLVLDLSALSESKFPEYPIHELKRLRNEAIKFEQQSRKRLMTVIGLDQGQTT